MDLKDETILSYYEEIASVGENESVFLVKHRGTGRLYIKKILLHYDKELYLRLQQYAFEGIPAIYVCIEDDNRLILIEEYIHGSNLEDIREQQMGEFDEECAVSYMIQLCNILEKLHQLQPPIIHRDIKPENIMISADGVLKLIDFDGAKTVREEKIKDTILFGTEGFASPEQYGFGQSDNRTDIYGIGMTLNYLLTGNRPNVSCPQGKLGAIIRKCVELRPEDRYQSTAELRNLLYQYNRGYMYDDSPWYIPPGFRTHVWWKMIIAVLGYLALLNIGLEVYVEHPKGPLDEPLTKLMAFLLELITVAWICNYLHIRELFPGMQRKGIRRWMLGVVFWALIMIAIAFFFVALIDLLY